MHLIGTHARAHSGSHCYLPLVDNPMKKPGGLVLGLGGDTSPGGEGTFYEGVVVRGYSTDEADDLVQKNIVSTRYGQQ